MMVATETLGDRDIATVLDHVAAFVTTEYASLTRAGAPVTWPVTPYRRAGRDTIDVSTGLTYPLKAERARRDPRVALSFSFPAGSGHEHPATVVVQGLATVRDADLRATSSSYLTASMERFPHAFAQIPNRMLSRMDWYWTRMWVEVTPVRVMWWSDGDLGRPPRIWAAPAGTIAPSSDPAPAGRGPGSWTASSGPDWRRRTDGAIERLGLPVLTTVASDGWPLPVKVAEAEPTASGFRVVAPTGIELADGPAFLTFHSHAEVFDSQENIGLSGHLVSDGTGEAEFVVDRALADWGVARNPVRSAFSMWRASRTLRPRLTAEAARRGIDLPRFEDLDLPPRR